MATQINLPTQSITSTGTTVQFKMLPLNVRAPLATTITTTAAGTNVSVTNGATAALMGAQTLTVVALTAALPNRARIEFVNGAKAILSAAAASAATTLNVEYLSGDLPAGTAGTWNAGALTAGTMYVPVTALVEEIDAGEVLTFTGSNKVTVTDYSPAGSTVLSVLPTTAALTVGNTATNLGLLTVAGATDATPSAAPKVVDATTYASGVGKEQTVTQIAMTLKVAYNLIVGDRGGNVLTKILLNTANYNREVFAIVKRPFDGVYQGAAIITQSSDAAPVQDLVKRTADMSFQGVSFSYTPYASY